MQSRGEAYFASRFQPYDLVSLFPFSSHRIVVAARAKRRSSKVCVTILRVALQTMSMSAQVIGIERSLVVAQLRYEMSSV